MLYKLKPNSQVVGIIALIIAMASLCTGSSYAKSLFGEVGPLGATSYRLSFSAMLLWCLWRPWRFIFSRHQFWAIIPYGLCLGAMNLTYYLALERIPLGIATAIEFLGPLSLAIFSSRHKIDFLWIAFMLIGLYLLLLHESHGPMTLDPLGIIFALLAGIFWALYIISGRRTRSINPGQATTIGITVAAILTLPFGLIGNGSELFQANLILVGLAVALLSSALPYSLEMLSLRFLPIRKYSILLSLEPAMATLAGLFILSESLSFTQYLAIALVVCASIGSTSSPDKKTTRKINKNAKTAKNNKS